MQRLGENAMWLREDNLDFENEIVLPFDDELALWDRPSWMDSLIRLRWCCPAAPPPPPPIEEKKPSTKSKKSKKKKKKSERDEKKKSERDEKKKSERDEKKKTERDAEKARDRDRGEGAYPYHQGPRYDVPPPSPVFHDRDNHGRGGYPLHYPYGGGQYPPYQLRHQEQLQKEKSAQANGIPNNLQNKTLVNTIIEKPSSYQSNGFALSSLSSSGTDFHTRYAPLPGATPDPGTPEDRPSAHAAQAAATAAAALKKQQAEKQRNVTSAKNPNRPPLANRGMTLLPLDLPSSGPKPPLPVQSRARSLSPSQRPKSPVGLGRPTSPNSLARPRLCSEGTKDTVSTRHRRQVHEEFDFCGNSLKKITEQKKDDDLRPTAPPAYIEWTHRPSIGDMSSCLGTEDDDFSTGNSVDVEIQNLVNRVPGQPFAYTFYADLAEDASLRARNSNLPALSWMNSWAAQGDAAAGSPMPGETEGESRSKDQPLSHSLTRVTGEKIKENISSIHVERPVYLPRCKALDKPIKKAKNRVIISGWAAISQSDQLRNRLSIMEGPLHLNRPDIGYFQLIRDSNKSKRPILRIIQDSGNQQIELKDRYDHQLRSVEVCGQAGRCVCLFDVQTSQVLLTILPVSLPKYFFRDNNIVEDTYFNEWKQALFTPFTNAPPRSSRDAISWGPDYCVTQYAPDEQYDAASHVLFALDSVLKPKPVVHSKFAG